MAETWPTSLQEVLNEEGFGFEIGDTTIRSDMEVGPAKVRRRMTKSVDKVSGTINLTSAQYTDFYEFYDITLNGGATTFLFNHPITGVETEFRFVRPPTVRSIGGGNFRAAMEWEILP